MALGPSFSFSLQSSLGWFPLRGVVFPPRLEPWATRASKHPTARRHLATHAATRGTAAQQNHVPEFFPRPDRGTLDHVLVAVQSQQLDRVHEAFLLWTEVLGDEKSRLNEAAVREAQQLPGPSFSEILRSLDPMLSGEHDIAHGLRFTQGQTQFTDVSHLVNKFGVRHHHCRVLRGMQILLAVRSRSRLGLSAADHEVMLRCAGAAADYQASKSIFGKMAGTGLRDARTAKTWTEFINARFMTQPTYYQFDRSRVAVLARDLCSNREPMPMARLKRLDRMRLSMNATKREPWNRRTDEMDEDMRRLLRRRADFRGYRNHWVRALFYGHGVDEELICASLVAFARSSSLAAIKTLMFQHFYGIRIDDESEPGNPRISGGNELPPSSPLRPTPRLLQAIVEAFGAMSHIQLGMKLLAFVSERYDVPIPPGTWSNLLSWAYLCASNPFRSMRRHHGDFCSTRSTPAVVRHIWTTMTSHPHNVAPTLQDHDVIIKTLIEQRSWQRALGLIRTAVLPLYRAAESAHELALQDEILQNDLVGPPEPTAATRRRTQAALRKDHIRHRITTWLDKLLKMASANRRHRNGAMIHAALPSLLVEFADFLPPQVRYRTAQGVLQLTRPGVHPKFVWRKAFRETLPQKKAGIHAREALHHGDEYPRVPTLKVLEWRRVSKRRMVRAGCAPGDGHGVAARSSWWRGVGEEMML